MALSYYNLGDYIQALSDLQEAKAIYEDLKLDDMIERCNDAIHICDKSIIASQTSRSSSNNFWLWFTAGLLLVILIWWLKR
jgi:tetratricopeptide (TPR) repeat protein